MSCTELSEKLFSSNQQNSFRVGEEDETEQLTYQSVRSVSNVELEILVLEFAQQFLFLVSFS